MEKAINVVEAKANFSEWMARVAYQGQRLVIERHGKPMMAWISMEDFANLATLDDSSEIQRQRATALALANEVRERIRTERKGAMMPDSAKLLNELREGSTL
jgi:prevent-host-death family protein